MLDLPAEPKPGVLHDTHRKASFAVGEPDDPLLESWPFLLIVRTGWVFTALHTLTVSMRCDRTSTTGYTGVPAYSQLLTAASLLRRADPSHEGGVVYLRTVIVTAAVYWGLVSKLWPKPNLST